MSSALDMSLDDMIKKNKKPSSGGYRGGRGGGAGPARRPINRNINRSTPYAAANKFGGGADAMWQHDMFVDQGSTMAVAGGFPMVGMQRDVVSADGGAGSGIETGTKLYISNLDYGVSNEDIKELFSEVGDLKRYSVHYDRSGRSKGTAEVVFSRRNDAAAAVKRYNNVQLDGKPMKIEIVGTNIITPGPMPPTNGILANPNVYPRSSGQVRVGAFNRTRGGPSGGRGFGRGRGGGGGRGRGRGDKAPVSATDLDADLDKYHSESMQIN